MRLRCPCDSCSVCDLGPRASGRSVMFAATSTRAASLTRFPPSPAPSFPLSRSVLPALLSLAPGRSGRLCGSVYRAHNRQNAPQRARLQGGRQERSPDGSAARLGGLLLWLLLAAGESGMSGGRSKWEGDERRGGGRMLRWQSEKSRERADAERQRQRQRQRARRARGEIGERGRRQRRQWPGNSEIERRTKSATQDRASEKRRTTRSERKPEWESEEREKRWGRRRGRSAGAALLTALEQAQA